VKASLRWLVAPVVLMALLSGASAEVRATDPLAGSQGTDISLPTTDSAVTISGRGVFSNISFTVNQTRNLLNQAISITWTGAPPTISGPGRFAQNYVQVFQCWGDDDGTNPTNPGPPPEQCQFGGSSGTYVGLPNTLLPDNTVASRLISRTNYSGYSPTDGWTDRKSGLVWRPFKAVDGTVINAQFDVEYIPGENLDRHPVYWLNPYFNSITTNELYANLTTANGTGTALFEVQTGLQAPGLGCGQKVLDAGDGTKKAPKCWLVIVPRGTGVQDNVGTPFTGNANGVVTSPLSKQVWSNRVAIPLELVPVDPACALSSVERRISGSELATAAISSWQPILCAGGARPPFSFAPVSDSAARQQLSSSTAGGPGMIVTSQPLAATQIDPAKPAVYAPLTVSGLAIGFNIERVPRPGVPQEAADLEGIGIERMNLTPRLVAKLLTQSYRSQVTILSPPPYTWPSSNPLSLVTDPDFLRFNPEFQQLASADDRTMSGLQLPVGTSDAAAMLWSWIFADAEAAAWLAGTPDEWGMKVNPVYATTAEANSTGLAFGAPVPSSFPKADPYCLVSPPRGFTPPPLCGTDWMPYSRNYAESARVSRIGFDGARIVENPVAATASQFWVKDQPQYIGRRGMLSLTDTTQAAQYGLQAASLSRANDNGSVRSFIAPNAAGLVAGVAAMKTTSDPAVLEPDPSAVKPGAYPLTLLTYAAIKPLVLNSAERDDFAAFIEYAAGAGQTPGQSNGELPRGYVPLPDAMKAQAAQAAATVRTMVAPTPTTTVPSTTPPAPPTTSRVTVTIRPSSSTPRPSATTTPMPETSTETTVPTDDTTTVPTETTVPPSTTTSTTEVESGGPAPTTTVAVTAGADVPPGRFMVVGLGVAALGSALGALEISKRARRASTAGGAA